MVNILAAFVLYLAVLLAVLHTLRWLFERDTVPDAAQYGAVVLAGFAVFYLCKYLVGETYPLVYIVAVVVAVFGHEIFAIYL